jgi:hypothetical protein
MKRILLIHLGANGDCVMVTAIARQIKVDYPGCHLTWCIGNRYASVLVNNPDVDSVWVFKLQDGEPVAPEAWYRCRAEAEKRKAAGEFDLIFNTQVYPDNIRNFDGTTRSSTFRNYPHPITVSVSPVVQLLPEELAKVKAFADNHCLSKFKHVVLMECSPGSGQSAFNLETGLELAKRLTAAKDDLVVVVSTYVSFKSPHERIIAANEISYRENVALTHYCTFLVGCSSGITWIGTVVAAKQLNTVQFVSRSLCSGFASVAYDFSYWGLSNDHIIENKTTDRDEMATIVLAALEDFKTAKKAYHQLLRPIFWGWLCCVDYRRGFSGIMGSWRTMLFYIKRNGLRLSDLLDVCSFVRVLKVALKRFSQ